MACKCQEVQIDSKTQKPKAYLYRPEAWKEADEQDRSTKTAAAITEMLPRTIRNTPETNGKKIRCHRNINESYKEEPNGNVRTKKTQ